MTTVDPVPTPEQNTPKRGLIIICIAAAAVSILAVVGLFFLAESRFQRFDASLERILQRVEKAEQKATQAEEEARSAAQAKLEADRERLRALQEVETARQDAVVAHLEADEAREQARSAREEVDRVAQEREQELRQMQETLNKIAETRRTALGLVMNLDSGVLRFDFNKATLRPENREILSRIAGVLLASSNYSLYVYGHTDDIGTAAYNQELSERRAETVRDYLLEVGIPKDRISTKGFGKTNPLVDGTSPDARARNRRVEIGIVNTRVAYEQAVKGTEGP